MAARVKLPPGGQRVVAAMHTERMKFERRALAAFALVSRGASTRVRDVILASRPDRAWTITDHAQAMRAIRAIARQLGADLSGAAARAAAEAAQAGAERTPKALAGLASASLGRRVPPAPLDLHRVGVETAPELDARTHDVGARAGEDVGQASVGVSYLATRGPDPQTAARVGAAVAAMFLARASSSADRVLVTEVTAGYGIGGRAAAAQMHERMPRLRKVWDATLDMRVCATCAVLHHVEVDDGQPFPGGFDCEPAHPRCRCATMPWLDDMTDALDALSIGPGVRTGVQESVELRLPSFGSLAPAGFGR